MLFFESNKFIYSRTHNTIRAKFKGLIMIVLLCGVQTSFAFFSHHSNETDLSKSQPGFLSSIEERLVSFVHKTVETVRHNQYKLGGSHFDTLHGIYAVDCSTYIDNILENVHPEAYSTLINSTGSEKPTTKEYYTFFSNLNDDSDYWNKVNHVKELRPGDILVFRNKGKRTGGHVMVVMNAPTKEATGYAVRVADSAPSGHSEDTRPFHNSGIGIGTLQLMVNPKTGEPSAYAWKVGSCWKKNVKFAMARPSDSQTG